MLIGTKGFVMSIPNGFTVQIRDAIDQHESERLHRYDRTPETASIIVAMEKSMNIQSFNIAPKTGQLCPRVGEVVVL